MRHSAQIPELGTGMCSVIFAERATGILLTLQGSRYPGEGEFYRVFDSEHEADAFAQTYVRSNPQVECSIRNSEGTHIRFVVSPEQPILQGILHPSQTPADRTPMKSFYQSSHWFWVISRIVIVLMFMISMVQIMSDGPLRRGDEVLVNAACMLGSLVLATLAIIEIARGKKPTWLRVAGGVFMVLFGLGLCVLLASGAVRGGLVLLLFLFIVWFLLAGVRDFIMR